MKEVFMVCKSGENALVLVVLFEFNCYEKIVLSVRGICNPNKVLIGYRYLLYTESFKKQVYEFKKVNLISVNSIEAPSMYHVQHVKLLS